MNKAELIRELSKQSTFSQKQCQSFLTALKVVFKDTLNKGEMISLAGFGKFYTKLSRRKLIFSPLTFQNHTPKSQILLKFRASSALKWQILV